MRASIQSRIVEAISWLVSNTLRLFVALVLPSGAFTANTNTLSELFPRAGFEDRVGFWKNVFTKYGERDIVFHDQEDLRLIYGVVSFDKPARADSNEALGQKRDLEQKELELKGILTDLGQNSREVSTLPPGHQEVLDLVSSLGYSLAPVTFQRLAKNMRSQRGIKEKFTEGVIRSGKYLSFMQDIFLREGLPSDLALLPHVESSFNYQARSHKGAAGIWQFMPSTGRRFLQITPSTDERLDPLRSSEAAARFLKENYERLGSWPLAITAYNHGPNGMSRARQLHGSDLLAIIEQYQSPLFGFASKNFYAEFLAVLEIAEDYERFLGSLELTDELQFETIHLDRSYRVGPIAKISGLNHAILSEYNPHVAESVWRGTHPFPAGTPLRVPLGKGSEVSRLLKGSARAHESGKVQPSGGGSYRVQAGDTLSKVAQKVGSTVETLQRVNGIVNPHELRAGQVLLLTKRCSVRTQYQVRRGDTLMAIAKRFGVRLEEILKLNRVGKGHRIFPGQVLLIRVAA